MDAGFTPPPPQSGWDAIKEKLKGRKGVIAAAVAVILLAAFFSLNAVMKALLHSRPVVSVPAIEGTTLSEALGVISQMNLSLKQDGLEFDESLPAGTIVRQHPPAGMEVREGRVVRVVISKGGQVVFVPNVTGIPLQEAQSRLASEGIQLGAIEEIFSSGVPSGTSISQKPSSGTVVTRGALVDLEVSKGLPPAGAPLVPDFVGQSVELVRDWVEEQGKKVRIKENPKGVGRPGTVLSQKPPSEQPLVGSTLEVIIVPLVFSDEGYRLSYRVPADEGDARIEIKARGSRGEYDVYSGDHSGGDLVEVPLNVDSTTRVRIFLNGKVVKETVVEP